MRSHLKAWLNFFTTIVGGTSLCSFVQHLSSITLNSIFQRYIAFYRNLLHPIAALLQILPFQLPIWYPDMLLMAAISSGALFRATIKMDVPQQGRAAFLLKITLLTISLLSILIMVCAALVEIGKLLLAYAPDDVKKASARQNERHRVALSVNRSYLQNIVMMLTASGVFFLLNAWAS